MVSIRDFIVNSILAQTDHIGWKQIDTHTNLFYREQIRKTFSHSRIMSRLQRQITTLNKY